MKTTVVYLSIPLLAGFAAAQEPQDHRPPPPQHVPQILIIFDEDRDGVISAREMRHASKALESLDRNGDRQITREELMPPRPEGAPPPGDNQPPVPPNGLPPGPPQGPPPGHRPPPPVIAALDTNKDGTLSAEELKAAPEALLKLDKDGDGELSPQELFPQGPPPPPPGNHEGGTEGPEEPE
jgi:hypothetical protein